MASHFCPKLPCPFCQASKYDVDWHTRTDEMGDLIERVGGIGLGSVPLRMSRRLVVDLDGTLCEQTRGGEEYATAAPRRDIIEKVNEYYDRGWHVVIFTARGMNSNQGDVWQAIEDYHGITTTWLYANGVKYHTLQFGKPAADMYVDDKGKSPDEFLRTVP